MKIEDFKNNLLNEIEGKWNQETKILKNTYEIKKRKLKEKYEKLLAEQQSMIDKNLAKIKASKAVLKKRAELEIFSQLSVSFTHELYKDFINWTYTPEGNKYLVDKINDLKKQFDVSKILVGKRNEIKGYDKGAFQSGIKIILKNGNEIDLSDAYFKVFVRERIYEVINDELFGNNKDIKN